jgi:hypothetical protein
MHHIRADDIEINEEIVGGNMQYKKFHVRKDAES